MKPTKNKKSIKTHTHTKKKQKSIEFHCEIEGGVKAAAIFGRRVLGDGRAVVAVVVFSRSSFVFFYSFSSFFFCFFSLSVSMEFANESFFLLFFNLKFFFFNLPNLFTIAIERKTNKNGILGLLEFRCTLLLGFFTEFYEGSLDFSGFDRVLLGFTGFYWVLLGFTEYCWVLPSFYWILPSFYWVLLGFT